MDYRQYGWNMARVLPPFRCGDITEAAGRVLKHYEAILPIVPEGALQWRDAFLAAQREVAAFARVMSDSPSCLEAYTRELNEMPPRFVWWWCVANSQLEYLWKN
jgi:hypothetical protein